MCSGGEMQFYCRVQQQQLEGFPLRMSGIDNSYKIDGDVLLVIHASIPPGVHRPTRTDRRRSRAAAAGGRARLRRRQHNSSSSWNYIGRRNPKFILDRIYRVLTNTLFYEILIFDFCRRLINDHALEVRWPPQLTISPHNWFRFVVDKLSCD